MEPESTGEPVAEYECEPVPARALLGFGSFVAPGVTAVDVAGGLLIGNLLAVLSWTFLVFWGWMDVAAMKSWMLGTTSAWFVATPFWMDRK